MVLCGGSRALPATCATDQFLLVERDAELAALGETFSRTVTKGVAASAVIEGPVGSGKTALLMALDQRAADAGALVLTAACARSERDLPFSAVRRLLQHSEMSATASQLARRLDEHTLDATRGVTECGATDLMSRRLDIDILALLQELTEQRPLVILVDDVQHIDARSMDSLLYAMRRMLASPVLLVLAASTVHGTSNSHFHDDLLQRPDSLSIRLDLLSEAGVRALVRQELRCGLDSNLDLISSACYSATGGNPRLVGAILADYRALTRDMAEPGPGTPISGEFFDRTVLRSLHRSSSPAVKLARGMAVLGDVRSVLLLARLTGLDLGRVTQALKELADTGVILGGTLRNGQIRAAILEEIPPRVRTELHSRAAELLHEHGSDARMLAEHLLAAGTPLPPWAIGVLQEAARQAMADGQARFAERCLELAVWSSTDAQQRATTRAMLLEVERRCDPAAADRHVPDLLEALRQGRLVAHDTVTLIRHLLWRGRFSEAMEALIQLDASGAGRKSVHSSQVRAFRLWLAHAFPPLSAIGTAEHPAHVRPSYETMLLDIDPGLRAAAALTDVLTNRITKDPVHDALQALQSAPRDEAAFESVRSALSTLLCTEQFAEAGRHCDRLLADAVVREGAPVWLALLTGLRAEAFLRAGSLLAAEHHAQSALEQLPPQGWGVEIGQPLTCLLLAKLALGKTEEAAELSARPVPPALMQSRHRLTFHYVRGRYHLAQDAPQAALKEFLDCGEQARAWTLDAPTFVPWRSGAAEAYLHLGQEEPARALLGEQLALVNDRYPCVRGVTLRLIAQTVDVKERVALLTEAKELLQAGGDRFELARTLLDLSTVHGMLGESRRGRMHKQLADRLAKECGASVLIPSDYARPHIEPAPEAAAALTLAERRVAMLAAHGHTNREIAAQLLVTPSTVEQHLTRVFRKLDVKQREELPLALGSHRAEAC
ncbi:AAA family ATPase [Streptomyces sp. NPDC059788]|uniref:AAA family ATPase n=1 Tax=Streptomyces sp. NPDC059788 TaxID=3346948 RepID=UPI00365B1354